MVLLARPAPPALQASVCALPQDTRCALAVRMLHGGCEVLTDSSKARAHTHRPLDPHPGASHAAYSASSLHRKAGTKTQACARLLSKWGPLTSRDAGGTTTQAHSISRFQNDSEQACWAQGPCVLQSRPWPDARWPRPQGEGIVAGGGALCWWDARLASAWVAGAQCGFPSQ